MKAVGSRLAPASAILWLLVHLASLRSFYLCCQRCLFPPVERKRCSKSISDLNPEICDIVAFPENHVFLNQFLCSTFVSGQFVFHQGKNKFLLKDSKRKRIITLSQDLSHDFPERNLGCNWLRLSMLRFFTLCDTMLTMFLILLCLGHALWMRPIWSINKVRHAINAGKCSIATSLCMLIQLWLLNCFLTVVADEWTTSWVQMICKKTVKRQTPSEGIEKDFGCSQPKQFFFEQNGKFLSNNANACKNWHGDDQRWMYSHCLNGKLRVYNHLYCLPSECHSCLRVLLHYWSSYWVLLCLAKANQGNQGLSHGCSSPGC